MTTDVLEFYTPDDGLVARVSSSIVPPVGALVNIAKVTYAVYSLSFCVDYSDDPMRRHIRVNVDLRDPRSVKGCKS